MTSELCRWSSLCVVVHPGAPPRSSNQPTHRRLFNRQPWLPASSSHSGPIRSIACSARPGATGCSLGSATSGTVTPRRHGRCRMPSAGAPSTMEPARSADSRHLGPSSSLTCRAGSSSRLSTTARGGASTRGVPWPSSRRAQGVPGGVPQRPNVQERRRTARQARHVAAAAARPGRDGGDSARSAAIEHGLAQACPASRSAAVAHQACPERPLAGPRARAYVVVPRSWALFTSSTR